MDPVSEMAIQNLKRHLKGALAALEDLTRQAEASKEPSERQE